MCVREGERQRERARGERGGERKERREGVSNTDREDWGVRKSGEEDRRKVHRERERQTYRDGEREIEGQRQIERDVGWVYTQFARCRARMREERGLERARTARAASD